MSAHRPEAADPWMTPLVTFTLIPATVHLGLFTWLLNQATPPTLLGELALGLCLVGVRSPTGAGLLILMAGLYLAILRQLRRAARPGPLSHLLLGLIYPVPLMTAAALIQLIARSL